MLPDFRSDLRFALRRLNQDRGFAAVAIATLALGIGANTAIFSVVNGVILKPLAYRDPDRIVTIRNMWKKSSSPSSNVSAPDFRDWIRLPWALLRNMYSNRLRTTITR